MKPFCSTELREVVKRKFIYKQLNESLKKVKRQLYSFQKYPLPHRWSNVLKDVLVPMWPSYIVPYPPEKNTMSGEKCNEKRFKSSLEPVLQSLHPLKT